jgi:hypothetical protein
MATRPRPGSTLPEDLRQRLDEAHRGLLRVHKALLDHERTRFERDRGRVGSAGEFLQLVIHDPWFAWLHAISELAVEIDELVSSKEPADPATGESLLAKARQLIVPDEHGSDFQRQYYRVMQESPDAAMAHGEWKLSAGHSFRKG